jgi:hypothetical protein
MSLIAIDANIQTICKELDILTISTELEKLRTKVVLNAIDELTGRIKDIVGKIVYAGVRTANRPTKVSFHYSSESDYWLKWTCSLNGVPYDHEMSTLVDDTYYITFKPISPKQTDLASLAQIISGNFKIRKTGNVVANAGGPPVQAVYVLPGETVEITMAKILGINVWALCSTSNSVIKVFNTAELLLEFGTLFNVSGDLQGATVASSMLVIPRSCCFPEEKDKADAWLNNSSAPDSIQVPIPSPNVSTTSLSIGHVELSDFGAVMVIPTEADGSFSRATQDMTLQRTLWYSVITAEGEGLSVLGRDSGALFEMVILHYNQISFVRPVQGGHAYSKIVNDNNVNFAAIEPIPFVDDEGELDHAISIVDDAPLGQEVSDPVGWTDMSASSVTMPSDDPTDPPLTTYLIEIVQWTDPLYGTLTHEPTGDIDGEMMVQAPPIGFVYALTEYSDVTSFMMARITSIANDYGIEMNQMFGLMLGALDQLGFLEVAMSRDIFQLQEEVNYLTINLSKLTAYVNELASEFTEFAKQVTNYINGQVSNGKSKHDFMHEWLPIIVSAAVFTVGVIAVVATGGAALAAVPALFLAAQAAEGLTTNALAASEAFNQGDIDQGFFYVCQAILLGGSTIGALQGGKEQGETYSSRVDGEEVVTDIAAEDVPVEVMDKISRSGRLTEVSATLKEIQKNAAVGKAYQTPMSQNIGRVAGATAKGIDSIVKVIDEGTGVKVIDSAIDKIFGVPETETEISTFPIENNSKVGKFLDSSTDLISRLSSRSSSRRVTTNTNMDGEWIELMDMYNSVIDNASII